MLNWEQAFVDAVAQRGCVDQDALKIANNAAHCDPVESAQVLLEGPLAGVQRVHHAWVRSILDYAVEDQATDQEKVLGIMEQHACCLQKKALALKVFYRYLVPDRIELALEHVWGVSNVVWRMVSPRDSGLMYYTKRSVLCYAYVRMLGWWMHHENADVVDVMDVFYSHMKQGMRTGQGVRVIMQRVLSTLDRPDKREQGE